MVKKLQPTFKKICAFAVLLAVSLSYGQSAPTATPATNVLSGSFTANWDAVTGATGYYLDVSTSPTFGTGTFATDLFISEYIEGSGFNKYIEIYNGTGATVNLANYELRLFTNGSATPSQTLALSGSLANGEVVIYRNSQAAIHAFSLTTIVNNTVINFNGDDAVGLFKVSTNAYVDVFGSIGQDPGSDWSAGSFSTSNNTLVRKPTVTGGVTNTSTTGFPTLAAEWTGYPNDTGTYLGSHTFSGGFTPSFVAGYNSLDVGNVTSYQVTGLDDNTVYYYRVRAYNGTGTSANSNTINVTTASCAAVPVPTVAPLTLCSPATVANLTVVSGQNPQWYSAIIGGTALASTATVTSGTYYASQTVNGCESGRVAVPVIVNPSPAAPQVINLSFCGNATVADLTVTSGTNPQWYAAQTGGTALASTAAVTTGTYYVSQSNGPCESARAAVQVTVNPVPDAPVADALLLCGASTVTDLTVTSGQGIQWYAAETGGTALAADAAVTTGTYYASQTVDGCESARTAVSVTVNPVPAAPTAIPLLFCGTATAADLTVTTTGAPVWYADATTTTALPAGTALATGTYYVSQIVDGCESERAAVTVTVNPIPDAPVAASQLFCGTAQVSDLMVTTGTAVQWYAAETGGTALATDAAVTTGTYYASQTVDGCESARTAVSITVNPVPAIPTVTPLLFCGTATAADLTATTEGAAIWYADADTETTLALDTQLATGTYYVSQIVNGCESERAAVTVTVNPIPAAPVADETVQEFCGMATLEDINIAGDGILWYAAANGGEALEAITALTEGTAIYYASQTVGGCESDDRTAVAVTFNVTPSPEAEDIALCGMPTVGELTVAGAEDVQWYNAETGGEALAADAAVTTGTYYVSQTVDGCESARTMVQVTVTPAPDAPTADNQSFCGMATVADLSVISGVMPQWYPTETGGMPLSENTVLTEGTYYVSQTINGCESARTAVQLEINAVPAAPVITNTNQVFCGSGTIEDINVDGLNVVWYAASSGGEMLDNEAPLLEGTSVYYVAQIVNGCESTGRTAVIVTLNITEVPLAEEMSFCNGATVAELMVTEGEMPLWYDSADATEPLAADALLATGTYYVTQTVDGCESEKVAVAVNITTADTPQGDAVQEFTAGDTIADLDVTGTDIVWFADAALTQMLEPSALLEDEVTYYAIAYNGDCPSEPLAVTADEVLSTVDNVKATFRYYPNPVSDVLTVLNSETITSVSVYNLLGQPVLETKGGATEMKVNLSSLAAGTYVVRATSAGAVQSFKVVKN